MVYNVPTAIYPTVQKQNLLKRKSYDAQTISQTLIKEDESLRIITATIHGMKYWSQQNFPYPMMFEIYGKLASQVTNAPDSNNIKEFHLQDPNDRIKCLFVEMDRLFVPVGRDLPLRIICRHQIKRGEPIARCISVRLANDDEYKEAINSIKLCDNRLHKDKDLFDREFQKKSSSSSSSFTKTTTLNRSLSSKSFLPNLYKLK